MGRLCERPGCSEDAAVAYGMRAEDLVFWLDALSARPGVDAGVLCRRHADSMVVPRGWTLDDLREPDLRLFRPPAPARDATGTHRRPRRRHEAGGEQLALGVEPPAATPDLVAPLDGEAPRSDPATPWMPSFDADDDLGGLLAARSPLLARAFRGADRPK